MVAKEEAVKREADFQVGLGPQTGTKCEVLSAAAHVQSSVSSPLVHSSTRPSRPSCPSPSLTACCVLLSTRRHHIASRGLLSTAQYTKKPFALNSLPVGRSSNLSPVPAAQARRIKVGKPFNSTTAEHYPRHSPEQKGILCSYSTPRHCSSAVSPDNTIQTQAPPTLLSSRRNLAARIRAK